ncbi:MAG TPA: hypothetical protein VJN96_22375 [Vicinamibacterales bacterium]|nr:hypothetical protein [Vicinamibacterales bacterium]
MNRAGGSALGSLVVLSVVLRVLFPSSTASGTQPPAAVIASTAAAAAVPAAPSDDGPWKTSQGYFAGTSTTCDAGATLRCTRWHIPNGTSVRAIIAIAPDPVRTHMALQFDRALEGIQLAAQASGYVVDRYWLPWSVDADKNSASQPAAGTSAAADRQQRLAQPGVVLFRLDASVVSTSPRLLFVFLVADTPTGGVDGAQFVNAVAHVGDVCGTLRDCAADGRIRIVGPTFSGSLASLRRLTDASKNLFTAYSGSVSSLCAMADQGLKAPTAESCQDRKADYKPATSLVFNSFVHDTESAVQQFVHALQTDGAVEMDCKQPQIAILSEGATTFGDVTQAATRLRAQCVQTFVFPREISNLRNAASAPAPGAAPAAGTTDATRPFLPLDLTDRTNSSDAPPDFSTKQGPLSKEAVLMNMAADLRRAKYRYVGIASTNVLDTLFLAEFLRAACPDARLFMISADLLFERELDNVPYVGMLAVTTYPLMNRNLEWTTHQAPGIAPQLPFADEYEHGGYNAMLQVLRDILPATTSSAVEMNQMRAPTGNQAKADPAAGMPLPLWMTVVGTGGYWPVRLLDGNAGADQLRLKIDDLSGAWQVVLLLTCGLAVLHVIVLLTAKPFAVRFRDFAPVAAVPRQRLFYIQTASATLVFGLGLLLLPVWRHAEQSGVWFQILGAVVMGAVILTALLLEALYCLRWRWRRRLDAQSVETSTRALAFQLTTFAFIWISTAALLATWWSLLGPDDTTPDSLYGFFFAYRAVHPVTGVSPLPPLVPLLACVYAWTCFEIWRLRFNDDMRPRLMPDATATPVRPRPGELTEQPIANAVNRYLLRPGYAIPFVVVFAVWLGFLHPTSPFELFERWGFGALYAVLFCLVVALMLSSGFRMAQIWVELRRLLIELERRPVRVAFLRIKGLNWSFWKQGGEDAEWAYMARSLEALGRLGSGSRADDSGLPAIEYFEKKITELRAHLEAKRLEDLKTGVVSVQGVLSSGRANPFLTSALEGLAARVDASLAVAAAPDHDVRLPAALAATAAAIADVQSALALIGYATSAQKSVLDIVTTWRGLQVDRPTLPAVDSLVEYASVSTRAGRDLRIGMYHTLENTFRGLQKSLAQILGQAWSLLEARWRQEAAQLVDHEDRDANDKDKKEDSSLEGRQLKNLEEFVALRYVAFIRGVLGHLRHVMIFLALSFSLVLISLNIYSFEPHQSLIWSFTVIFVVTGFMVIGVLVQLHRDPILSRVTGTTGNALDLHFYLRLFAFGAVPLLTLLATHFPSIGHYLLSFLRPSLEALK